MSVVDDEERRPSEERSGCLSRQTIDAIRRDDHSALQRITDDSGQSVDGISTYQHTAIHEAARHGAVNCIKLLLAQKGFDINRNMLDSRVEMLWGEGGTPLHTAARLSPADRSMAVCALLIANGANVDARSNLFHVDDGLHQSLSFVDVAPLHLACMRGSSELVRLLIDDRAFRPSRHHRRGSSYRLPHYYAVTHGNVAALSTLLDYQRERRLTFDDRLVHDLVHSALTNSVCLEAPYLLRTVIECFLKQVSSADAKAGHKVLLEAVSRGYTDIVNLLFHANKERIVVQCIKSDSNVLGRLLSAGYLNLASEVLSEGRCRVVVLRGGVARCESIVACASSVEALDVVLGHVTTDQLLLFNANPPRDYTQHPLSTAIGTRSIAQSGRDAPEHRSIAILNRILDASFEHRSISVPIPYSGGTVNLSSPHKDLLRFKYFTDLFQYTNGTCNLVTHCIMTILFDRDLQDFVESLLRHGAMVNAKAVSDNEMPPLSALAFRVPENDSHPDELIKVFRTMLDHGADMSHKCSNNNSYRSPDAVLLAAVVGNSWFLSQLLSTVGCCGLSILSDLRDYLNSTEFAAVNDERVDVCCVMIDASVRTIVQFALTNDALRSVCGEIYDALWLEKSRRGNRAVSGSGSRCCRTRLHFDRVDSLKHVCRVMINDRLVSSFTDLKHNRLEHKVIALPLPTALHDFLLYRDESELIRRRLNII